MIVRLEGEHDGMEMPSIEVHIDTKWYLSACRMGLFDVLWTEEGTYTGQYAARISRGITAIERGDGLTYEERRYLLMIGRVLRQAFTAWPTMRIKIKEEDNVNH